MAIFFGLLLTLGGVQNIGNADSSLLKDITMLMFLGILPTLGGVFLIRNAILESRRERAERREKILLEVAERHNWVLTPVDLAKETDINLKESQKDLDEMVKSGFAELDIESGGTTYRFFRPEKSRVDPLEEQINQLENTQYHEEEV